MNLFERTRTKEIETIATQRPIFAFAQLKIDKM